MMAERWGGIYFLLDGKQLTFRAWANVPRVGEWVVFSLTDEPFEVARVLWRETADKPVTPYAEIILKKVTSG
jgi:hypothetical protein